MRKSEEREESTYFKERRKSDRNFLVIMFFIATHIGGSVWWASKITTKQEFLMAMVSDLKEDVKSRMSDRYRGIDAKRDFSIRDLKIEKIEEKVDSLIKRVPAKIPPQYFEDKVDDIEKRLRSLERR